MLTIFFFFNKTFLLLKIAAKVGLLQHLETTFSQVLYFDSYYYCYC